MIRSIMKLTLTLILTGTAIFLSACGTIRLRYEALTEDKGKAQSVAVEKSYPVGGAHKTLCWMTGIFFGGSCWYYLVMPTTQQRQTMMADAVRIVQQRMGEDSVRLRDERVVKAGWDDRDTDVRIEGVRE